MKVMKPDLAIRPELASRFHREARAMARLRHEGIVTIHRFGERDRMGFLLMEHIPGTDLSQLLEPDELLPVPRVLEIMSDLCDALNYAHEKKVVHRDLKGITNNTIHKYGS